MCGAGDRAGGLKQIKASQVIPSQLLGPDKELQDMAFAPPGFSLFVSLFLVLPASLSTRMGIPIL